MYHVTFILITYTKLHKYLLLLIISINNYAFSVLLNIYKKLTYNSFQLIYNLRNTGLKFAKLFTLSETELDTLGLNKIEYERKAS